MSKNSELNCWYKTLNFKSLSWSSQACLSSGMMHLFRVSYRCIVSVSYWILECWIRNVRLDTKGDFRMTFPCSVWNIIFEFIWRESEEMKNTGKSGLLIRHPTPWMRICRIIITAWIFCLYADNVLHARTWERHTFIAVFTDLPSVPSYSSYDRSLERLCSLRGMCWNSKAKAKVKLSLCKP
jgi:hypothetical protein